MPDQLTFRFSGFVPLADGCGRESEEWSTAQKEFAAFLTEVRFIFMFLSGDHSSQFNDMIFLGLCAWLEFS